MTATDWATFDGHRRAGRFVLSWERPMPDGSSVGYGCLPVGPGKVPVLMAGHGDYTNQGTVDPADALDGALLVGVVAPFDVRSGRLSRRSPGTPPARAGVLLAHDDDLMRANVDLVLENHGR